MKTLLALALVASPALAHAQATDSLVRRVIDAQLATGLTQPPGPGVPGNEAERLLGRGLQQRGGTPSALPAGGATAPGAGTMFGPGQTGIPAR